MAKPLFKSITLVLLALSSMGVFLVVSPKANAPYDLATNPDKTYAQENQPNISHVLSPDGNWSAILKQNQSEESLTYSFLIKNYKDNSTKEILNLTSPIGVILQIPQNTFSSDNKYVFLIQNNQEQVKYLVLKTNGEDIAKDSQTIEISALFYAKYDKFKITDVTGWAGPTLLIINTDNLDGSLGPSFWYDLASRSFIRLSDRFN